MAVIVGARYSWSDSDNVVRDVSNTINFLDPRDRVFLDLFGTLQTPCTETKHEWLEKTLRPMDGAVANDTSFNDVTDTMTFNVVAGQGLYLRVGDVLLVGSELVKITVVNVNAITVSRGWGTSTPAAHPANTPWHLVAPMVEQDAAVGGARTLTKTPLFNYTQFYEGDVIVTTTQQAIKKYTEQNDFDIQTADEIINAWQTYDRSLLVGRKVQPVAGTAGAMDGLLARITTNAYPKAGAGATEAMILQGMQDSYAAGGRVDKLVVPYFQKRTINTFLDSMRETTRTDTTAGAVVDSYTSDFGTVDVILSRTMSLLTPDTILGLQTSRLGFGPLTDHTLSSAEVPQVTRTKHTNQIIGQYTSEIRNENAHFVITGLATS